MDQTVEQKTNSLAFLVVQPLVALWKLFLVDIVVVLTGIAWNVTLNVHYRPWIVGYHIVNGHRVFYYSSKVLSDFIGVKGYSIGDLLIIFGIVVFVILELVLVLRLARKVSNRGGDTSSSNPN